MLEPVALHQSHFNMPGVAPDGRGILLGKLTASLFASLDQTVRFLALLSERSSLDDLLPTLKLYETRSALESRSYLVLFQATSSHFVDQVAQLASLTGGTVFTGSAKHFVRYRDAKAPLGYDVTELARDAVGCDFFLYAEAVFHSLIKTKEIVFRDLVTRLSLRPLPGGALHRARAFANEVRWIAVRPGLYTQLLTYLWRNRIAAEAMLIDNAAHEEGYLLVRVAKLPERILALLVKLPGVEVHLPLTDNALIELGYRHPFRLESCPSLFAAEQFFIFSAQRRRTEILAVSHSVGGMGLPLMPIEQLIATGFELEQRPLSARAAKLLESVVVNLRLVSAQQSRQRATGTLIPWSQVALLKQLVFALPPTLLSGYRVAALDEGLMVISHQIPCELPLGEQFQEAAPSVFVPLGHAFVPRVSDAVLTDYLGGTQGRIIVFRDAKATPFSVEDSLFEPLGRRLVAQLEVPLRPSNGRLRPPQTATARVENDPVGPLPLWGFRPPAGDQ